MKYIIFYTFLLVAGAQIFVPARMIWQKENVLKTGEAFRFKTRPVDPNDPFRGKYVVLNFMESQLQTDTLQDWNFDERVFVVVENDVDGFATIASLEKKKPKGQINYFVSKINSVYQVQDSLNLMLDFPFERFYMEETKAPIAEELFRVANQDDKQNTYAIVKIKSGEAVLEDVEINGQSLRELATSAQDKPK